MSSIGGAIRKVLVDANLPGVTEIYRDFGPPTAEKPYITYWDELRDMPELVGGGKVLARLRQVQVDIWQDRNAENMELSDLVVAALDGLGRITSTKLVYKVKVSDIQRMVSSQDNLVHHAITLDVYAKA